MSSNLPDHLNGRREVAVAETDAAETALEKIRPLLKPDKVQEARVVLARTMSKFHSGPIPSAEEMEHLERIASGSANRCFAMAEREQEHRHFCDKAIIDKEFGFRARGQRMAMAAVILLLAAVAYLAYLQDTKAAAYLGATTLVGLVLAFTASKYIDSRADVQPGTQQTSPPPKEGKPPPKRNSRR